MTESAVEVILVAGIGAVQGLRGLWRLVFGA
jgi:hypothetical protein